MKLVAQKFFNGRVPLPRHKQQVLKGRAWPQSRELEALTTTVAARALDLHTRIPPHAGVALAQQAPSLRGVDVELLRRNPAACLERPVETGYILVLVDS